MNILKIRLCYKKIVSVHYLVGLPVCSVSRHIELDVPLWCKIEVDLKLIISSDEPTWLIS